MLRHVVSALAAVIALGACTSEPASPRELVVYDAASLSAPMRALLDTFSRRTGAQIVEEHGASLELARRITELHRVPDVIALADQEVFPELLVPRYAAWYAAFARNRMVVAYTDRSKFAAGITAANWPDIVTRPSVLFGRTDPVLAPAGYRALLTFRLAERFYHEPGLAARLEAASPASHIRGNAADLAALLETGELDYILEYESLARSHHFRFVALPSDIDLGDATKGDAYAAESVRVASSRDTVLRRGAPILYGVSVPKGAPNRETGEAFVRFLLGAQGQGMLRARFVDALAVPSVHGEVPPGIAPTSR